MGRGEIFGSFNLLVCFPSGGETHGQVLQCIATSVVSVPLFVVCGLTIVVLGWLNFAIFLINLHHFIQHIAFRATSGARLRRKP